MSQNPYKVLIVEDSPTTRFFMKQALRGAGYQVITANTGPEGLTKGAAYGGQEGVKPLLTAIRRAGADGRTSLREWTP